MRVGDDGRGGAYELLNRVFELLDLVFELGALVGRHGRRDHRPRHAARPAKRLLVWDEHVRHVLRTHNRGRVAGLSLSGRARTGGAAGRVGIRLYPPPHLVLAEQRQMEQDLERLGIGRHDDQLGNATVERLGGCDRAGEGV